MLFELAQINIARFKAPKEDPANADFMAALDAVNAHAEAHPGFIWRLVGEGDNATDIQAFADPHVIVNMSVWRDLEALASFVYRTDLHRSIMARRREWFETLPVSMALWWVPLGHRPTVEEGRQALEKLAKLGPTEAAFTFRTPYPAQASAGIAPILDECA
jgi:hypothetical protein